MYRKEKVTRYFDEYCVTHQEIVPEDDSCPHQLSEESCDIEDDYEVEETKFIIHDENHLGTFEELEFEWDDRYVDGGYVIKY